MRTLPPCCWEYRPGQPCRKSPAAPEMGQQNPHGPIKSRATGPLQRDENVRPHKHFMAPSVTPAKGLVSFVDRCLSTED